MATVISTCELERLVPDPEVGTAHRRLVGIGLTGSTTFLHGPLYSADRTSGTVVICDGPYVETKELLGGFAVVDVADDEAAKVGRARPRRHAAGPMRFAASRRSPSPSDPRAETHRSPHTWPLTRWRPNRRLAELSAYHPYAANGHPRF